MDLKDGQVVHAVRGERNRYKPIHLHSKLTASSDIDAVMTGFLNLYPFDTFYIADLNAIGGIGDHCLLMESLLAQYPNICFWIDDGSQLSGMITNRPRNHKTVIGTESQLSQYCRSNQDFILSLDFKQQQPCGHSEWFEDSRLWPKNVIVMTLSRVGGDSGPDFQTLAELCAGFPDTNFIAAGGVRNSGDLIRLGELGVSAALLATALHGGAISGREIKNLQTKKYPGKPGYF